MSDLIADDDKAVHSLSSTDLLKFLQLYLDVGAVNRFQALLLLCHPAVDFVYLIPQLAEQIRKSEPVVAGLFLPAFELFARRTLKSLATTLRECRKTDLKQLLTFGCPSDDQELPKTCEHGCVEVRKFLIEKGAYPGLPISLRESPTLLINRKNESRKHVETYLEHLRLACTRDSLLTWRTDVSGSPHTLVITKASDPFWSLATQIPRAQGYLSALGSLDAQKRILDNDYAFIAREINKASWPNPGSQMTLGTGSPASGYPTASKRLGSVVASDEEGSAAKRARSESEALSSIDTDNDSDCNSDEDWRPSRSRLHCQ
ncbi:hypothetical protein MIND_01320700 [Mycena indigotica]|uniref:Uncharacterized protein n=1 Tax=Mycena indigotica TaxID=2126181 RepID=A0A8H6S1N2_9AGAR|nr:uncharacterized protein MIND_01320700 [Mycena indigotica]KAF7290797.1 hypothetical protein MIND_01320700 [Mycena indigotica]